MLIFQKLFSSIVYIIHSTYPQETLDLGGNEDGSKPWKTPMDIAESMTKISKERQIEPFFYDGTRSWCF